MNFLVPLSDFNARELFYYGMLTAEPEFRLTQFLIRELRSDDVFFDIGANYGFYSGLALELIEEGEVHTFEPNHKVTPFLRWNLSEYSESVTINELGVLNKNGKTQFYQSEGSSSVSSVKNKIIAESKLTFSEIKINTITLDKYISSNSEPTVLKIDVEGAENLVIEGGKKALQRSSPTVIIEIWDSDTIDAKHQEAINQLKRFDYKPHILTDKGKTNFTSNRDLFKNNSNLDCGYKNIVFKKENNKSGL